MTPRVREVLEWYKAENLGVLDGLVRLMGAGDLAGTGKLAIVSDGNHWASSPEKRFATNKNSYDPLYQLSLAADLGVSAFSAQLGALKLALPDCVGEVLTLLELNLSNLPEEEPSFNPQDVLNLGCIGVKISLPISEITQLEPRLRALMQAYSSLGRVTVLSGTVSQEESLAPDCLDLISQFVQSAAQAGAHIVNVCFPENKFSQAHEKKLFLNYRIKVTKAVDRIKHVIEAGFSGKKIILFSLDETLDAEELLLQGKEIARGGGFGTIVSSDLWYKYSKEQALDLNKKLLMQFKY